VIGFHHARRRILTLDPAAGWRESSFDEFAQHVRGLLDQTGGADLVLFPELFTVELFTTYDDWKDAGVSELTRIDEFTDDYRQLQPHWDVITSQEQVQVYEERYVYKAGTGPGTLNTSFLGVNEVVKDNRLLPRGYQYKYLLEKANAIPGDDEFESLLPTSLIPKAEGSINPRDDPDYTSGSGADTVTYRIPVAQLTGAVAVRAQLNYQSLPPYWLRERFASGKLPGGTSQQTQRLYYLTGHVNLEQSKIPGWKLKVQDERAQIP